MEEKCDTPDCLRGVVRGDTYFPLCLPCQKGMRPMTNPKSPHAWNTSTSKNEKTTGKPKDQDKPTNKPKPKLKIVIPKSKQENWKKDKSDMEIKRLQRKAVELIFTTYWYGWPKGVPKAFTEIFKDYGAFITGREVPSKMVGTPDIHTSHINARGNSSFVLVMEAIYPIQGEASTFREIERSPIMREALGDVSPTDAIEMVKNDGGPFTFTKKDEKTYTWDDNGIKREIPKWAIA